MSKLPPPPRKFQLFGKRLFDMDKRRVYFILSFTGLWIPFLLRAYFLFNWGVVSYFGWMMLIVFINIFLERKFLSLIFIFLNTLLFALFCFVDIGYFLIFKNEINRDLLYIILETNILESKEFMQSYLLEASVLLLGGLHIISVIFGGFIWYYNYTHIKISKQDFTKNKIVWLYRFALALCFCLLGRTNFTPYNLSKGIKMVLIEWKNLEKVKKFGRFENVYRTQNEEKETFVLIIGESTTRTHMGLYGYYRQTNPLLSERKKKGELFVWNRVRTTYVHTIDALSDALALDNTPATKFNSTLTQLFNAANFSTYFISNQKPWGMYDTTVTKLTKVSNEICFTTGVFGEDYMKQTYDEAIVPYLKEVLKQKTTKKLIIIHLMGTHMSYKNRYPPTYEFYKEKPRTKFNHITAYKQINAYDNAVRYNDYVIDRIINEVAKDDTRSFVLYFSDHGDEVYESIDFLGHTEGRKTEPMQQIPFMIWYSKSYKQSMPDLVWEAERKYNHRDLIHTMADLAGIKFKRFRPEKSIVNSQFKK